MIQLPSTLRKLGTGYIPKVPQTGATSGVSLGVAMNIEKRVELMELFTETYRKTEGMPKSLREIACMKTQFPEVFTLPVEKDLFAGRFIMLPVGHGLEWAHLGGGDTNEDRVAQITHKGSSIPEMNSAGPSYYGLVGQLSAMKGKTPAPGTRERIDALIRFWAAEDTHAQMIQHFEESHHPSLFDGDINNFLPPFLALTRLSGIELDYEPLLSEGIRGFRGRLARILRDETSEFIEAGIGALDLLESSLKHYIEMLEASRSEANKSQYDLIIASLNDLLEGPPSTFHSGLQLVFLYSQLAGVVNYGRMDDYMGALLAKDIEDGRITKAEATGYLESLWHLINECCNRGNGRVIVGGMGRKHPGKANLFAELAILATMNTRIVKPQLTLRMDESTPEHINALAMDAIGEGCTFPMLYNDRLNVPSVRKAMNVPEEDAKQYVPYGCGEYIICGRGIGSPNACVNFTKVLQLALNRGVDPYDGAFRGGDFAFREVDTFKGYDELEAYYFAYLDYILMTTVHFQHESYQHMAKRSSFVFSSLLMHDCIARRLPILDGGIRYYSGVNEFYGFSNAIDALQAIKTTVFDEKLFTLADLAETLNRDFRNGTLGHTVKDALGSAEKFGNDLDSVDAIGIRLHEHACGYIRDHASDVGLHSFLAVNINNNANTRWGIKTGASADGRHRGEHLAPGNNPHSGRDHNGITAMLNSISKFRPDIHAGYVQNLMCSPKLFNEARPKSRMLLNTYFKKPGGTQIMINVMDRAMLVEAQKHPEQHQNLIVRCGGFSAKFVELDPNTQNEIIQRTCNA